MGNKEHSSALSINTIVNEQLKFKGSIKSKSSDKSSNTQYSSSQYNKSRHNNNNGNDTIQRPIPTASIINDINLYSIIDLAHHIKQEHCNSQLYQRDIGMYSSSLFYCCQERDMGRNSNKKTSKINSLFNYKSNTNAMMNSKGSKESKWLNNPNMTIKSCFKSSCTLLDDGDSYDSRSKSKLLKLGITRYGSCENIKRISRDKTMIKGSLFDEPTIHQQDDQTSIGKDYRKSMPIKEETERSLHENQSKVLKQFLTTKQASLQSSKTENQKERSRKAYVFAERIRSHFLKSSSKKRNRLEYISSNDLNDTSAVRILPYEKAVNNFLYENINKEDYLNDQGALFSPTKMFFHRNETDRFTHPLFKIDLTEYDRHSWQLIKHHETSKRHNNHPTFNPRGNHQHQHKIKSRNRNREKTHMHFISTIEHLMDVDPNNRAEVVKSKIKQMKEEENHMITPNKITYLKENLQTKEQTEYELTESQLIFNNANDNEDSQYNDPEFQLFFASRHSTKGIVELIEPRRTIKTKLTNC